MTQIARRPVYATFLNSYTGNDVASVSGAQIVLHRLYCTCHFEYMKPPCAVHLRKNIKSHTYYHNTARTAHDIPSKTFDEITPTSDSGYGGGGGQMPRSSSIHSKAPFNSSSLRTCSHQQQHYLRTPDSPNN